MAVLGAQQPKRSETVTSRSVLCIAILNGARGALVTLHAGVEFPKDIRTLPNGLSTVVKNAKKLGETGGMTKRELVVLSVALQEPQQPRQLPPHP